MSADRDDIQQALEGHLDSMHFTYSQHFAVANFNRWLGRAIDFLIFSISAAVVIAKVVASLSDAALIVLLLLTAGLSAFHRSARPGEQETRFRGSAHAYHDLFNRGRSFLQVDLHDESLSDEEIRERYGEFFEEYLGLNQQMPDASSLWYRYMMYIKGEDKMAEEVVTTDEKRYALSGDGSNGAISEVDHTESEID